MIAVIFVIMRYYKKDIPRKVTFIHVFDKKLQNSGWRLNINISENKNVIFSGEYHVKGKKFRHNIKLPTGNYSGTFILTGHGETKTVNKDLTGEKTTWTIKYGSIP